MRRPLSSAGMKLARARRGTVVIGAAGVLAVGLAACGGDSGSSTDSASGDTGSSSSSAAADTGSAKGKHFGAVVLTKQGEFYVAYQRAMNKIAEDTGSQITVADSDAKVERQQQNVEDLLTKGVDAIAISPVDAASVVPLIKQAQGQDTRVVTVTVPTKLAPVVVEDSIKAGREGGAKAATWFHKHYGNDTQINIAIVGWPQLQQTVDRANGFVEGVKSVDPKAKVVVNQDGGAVLDKATAAAENMLQAHPEANLWFGINDDSALGALNALKGAGRGTTAKKDLVVGFDGSAKGICEIMNPKSAMKVDIGNQPYTYAKMAVDDMAALADGKTPAEKSVPPVTLLSPEMGKQALTKFYTDQYLGTLSCG